MGKRKVLAWHIVNSDRLAVYDRDENGFLRIKNTGERLVTGKTYRVDGKIKLCMNGLHASYYVVDADSYKRIATDRYLCRVELSGTIRGRKDDKYAASERTILWKKKLTKKDVEAFFVIVFGDGPSRTQKLNELEKWALSLEPKKKVKRG